MWYYAYWCVSSSCFIFLFLHLVWKAFAKPPTIVARAVLRCTSWCISSYFSVFVHFPIRIVSKILANYSSESSSSVGKRDWESDVLPDALQEISDRLPLRDFVAFRSVCRLWRSAPSGRSEITNFRRRGDESRLWLVLYGLDNADDACYVYAHPHPNCCTVRLPQLRDANIKQTNSGWLFAHRHDHFFLFNPFTLVKVDLPDHKVDEDQVCTMTAPSPSRKCTVFIVSRKDDSTLEISSCRVGDTSWNSHTAEISKDQLGVLVVIYVCICINGAHREELCGLQDKTYIHISGSKNSLRYDCVRKGYVDWVEKQREKASLAWINYFKSPSYWKDWLERFGPKGISISICSTRIRIRTDGDRSGTVGIKPYNNFVVKGDEESIAELKSLKAFWIEPSFS